MSPTHPKSCATLPELAERLRTTDLIPSQQPLLEQTDERLARLSEAGITSVADLLKQLRYTKSVPDLAARSGVDPDFLASLRRAVRGFFPRPEPLRGFHWIAPESIAALGALGIKNSEQFCSAWVQGPGELVERSLVSADTISELAELCGLVRVQWISPNFARALRAAGFSTPAAVSRADPAELTRAVNDANKDRRFFNATIGERDIRRVVDAASYVA